MASDLGMDMITKRPRTPRDPYTTLTNVQVKNLKKDPSAFFMPSRPEKPYPDSGWTRDRYARDMSEHFIRGVSKTHPYCYIDEQWQRNPPQQYDTCRLGASERWGPQKVGSRTVQHFNKAEDVNRFLITDVYRRPPTNLPGRIIMDHGRPHDGYYVQRKPNMTTWFGSTVPLNQTAILQTVPQKTTAEYAQIREREKETMLKSRGQLSEYVDRYSMQTKLDPIMNTRQRMKMYQAGTV